MIEFQVYEHLRAMLSGEDLPPFPWEKSASDSEKKKQRISTHLNDLEAIPFPRELAQNSVPDGAELLPASTIASAQRFLDSTTLNDFRDSYAGFNGFQNTEDFLLYTLRGSDEAIGRFPGKGD